MRQMGLQAVYPKRGLSKPAPGHRVYPYLLRTALIERPDDVWAIDITYVRLCRGFAYLTAVLDWWSRFVVAWRLSPSLEVGFCLEALDDGLTRGRPTHVYHGGGKFVVNDAADTPDTIEATWQFDGWTMQYIYRGFNNQHFILNRPSHHGIRFHGDKGSMVLDRKGYTISRDDNPGKPTVDLHHDESDGQWERTFIDCVKGDAQPPMDFEDSHRATVCCHLANVSYKVGRSFAWDGKKERIVGDPEASALLGLPRRKGYELPKR